MSFPSSKGPLGIFLIASAIVFLFIFFEFEVSSSYDRTSILLQRDTLDQDGHAESYQLSNISQLTRRADDDYHCKKGVLCKTQACCGSFQGTDTGICGFGPTFCGDDCDSQCDAKPECGQYADPPNKKCPLNVCCSEYGFCGSTELFCTDGCQSNCVLDPPVPAGGAGTTVLGNKIIGYYEAWSARRGCRTFPPNAIPVEGLTHVNFAFAYIDPDSLQVTTMDSLTPEGLFAQTTDVKNFKSRASTLEVFVSIGGWTFSDNGTTTQAVFPAIAADPGKRQKFADNLVSFMTRYGFDGVDLDWEYPGAPDRGGLEEEDIANFPQLLNTLRSTFLASARGNYGLSFTAPTSYWYLRWFDIPACLKYADWVNLMSYDLHGVWDEHNPIGSIVQGHTNLTEIKLAVDLLWRNNVPPGQVVLGLGFYGRSFELQDPSCSTPGCPFSGPARPGECTDSAGTLAYFEIKDVIAAQKPQIIHDNTAAINYIVFGDNNDQWVSYDDATTFKQKVDWADSVGLGGLMIWSVDQDDLDFSALSGLLGESLPSFEENLKRAQTADTDHWSSVNGQACKISDCVSDLTNPPSGFSIAPNGKFKDTCGGDKNKYVYCPTDALPQSCEWRGSGSCHGQCHPGEVTLAHSPHGSLSCLKPGQQAFCCVTNTWASFVDKCGWVNSCDDCPSDAQYSVNTRTIRKGLFGSCKQNYCCPYDFQNCHWVGKGTCDDNECSATDVEVGLDPTGDTGSQCAGGLNGRQKPLCCNTPQDLNPFLPVPLENLFPTLPPASDIPAFEHQSLSYSPGLVGANPNVEAFFFVVIDGPPGTVSNLNKRDGSHLEFITSAVHYGQAPQTAHFVCMDDSAESNCDDIHLNGLEGTVVRMPDGMGFAQWAVAHSLTVANFSVPNHLVKRAPAGSRVYELTYSYDFSKVKRDSGPVYLRVDYADSNAYYTDIVQADPQKRELEPRFWSKISSIWKTLVSRIRGHQYYNRQPSLSKNKFNVLIYGDDGHDKGCNSPDGFLKINLAGSMQNTMRWGYTLVGTIQPFSLEEAFGFFDSDMYMSAQLDFDGKGVLNINQGAGVARNLFSSPVSDFQASHPGIVSFSPELNAEISLVGSGEIDGQFSVSFEAGSTDTLTTNAPPGLGTFGGSPINSVLRDAADGYLSVANPTYNTIFGINVNLETTMNMKIFGYETSLQDAGATFAARTPHAIRVIGNSGTGKPGILDAPQQASADVIQFGTVMDGWDDGTTHPIGSMPNPVSIFDGGDPPPNPRQVPDINGYAVFGDHDFMSCSSGSYSGTLTCTYLLISNDSSLKQPDPPYRLKFRSITRDDLEPLSERETAHYSALGKRAPGPSGGSSATYYIVQYPPDQNGNSDRFEFNTPTYPNGNDGAALDAENGRNDRYALANPGDCEDTSITSTGVQGVNWQDVDAEHPEDRSVFPNHFATFAQTGVLDIADGQGGVYRTSNYFPFQASSKQTKPDELTRVVVSDLPLFDFDNMYNYFAHEYRIWVPPNVEQDPPAGSAAGDVADAMGSTTNADNMSNLERALNILKGRLYTTEGLPTADDLWNIWMNNPGQGTAEAALSALRAVFGVFNYMNSIRNDRQATEDGMMAALSQFDNLYARTFPNRPERLAGLRTEFRRAWLTRVTNFAQRYVTQRLNQLTNVYQPLSAPNSPSRVLAQDILAAVARMRARIPNELVFQ